ncbi:putative transferase, protein kinase RLK-Pelle-CrRLK1L-1 family [Helianthus anomalus]
MAVLSWLQLLKICIGVAQGLDYLHTRSRTKLSIIHCDLKSSNVLLHADFVAKFLDFGIARTGLTNQKATHLSTVVKGTFGYFDPSYFNSGKLRIKSDVYAFGVILLEVICGLPAVHNSEDGDDRGLAPWAKDCIKQGRLNDIIDRRLSGQIASKCGKDFARIAWDTFIAREKGVFNLGKVVSVLVFKGWNREQSLEAATPGTSATVAVVKKNNGQYLQSQPEWLAEVNCLGQIDHPNLVKLISYCADNDHKILVYEFMERGSLDSYLFRRRFYTGPLAWNLRIKIALGAAKGLAYLHKPESKVVCHDFNSTSILIDSRCIDKNGPEGERILVEFAKPFLTKDLKEIENIIDPHRDEHYSSGAAHVAALIAKRCLYEDPKCRSTADEIVEELERLQLPLTNFSNA